MLEGRIMTRAENVSRVFKFSSALVFPEDEVVLVYCGNCGSRSHDE